MGLRDLLLVYANDTAIVLHDLWASGFGVASLFLRIGCISSLFLNFSKCVCIPLWHFDKQEVRSELAAKIPTWSDFIVKDFGRYLGLFVGLGAKNKE